MVLEMRNDLNTDTLLSGIEALDLEMQKLENNKPYEWDDDDEVDHIIAANKELRDKVNDVSMLVKKTLIKISVRHITFYPNRTIVKEGQ